MNSKRKIIFTTYIMGILYCVIFMMYKGRELESQTLCQDAALCLQDFECEIFSGRCLVTPSSFQYRLVSPPCAEIGEWSNWDGDQCGAYYPWWALECLVPVGGCGGLRAYPDGTCM